MAQKPRYSIPPTSSAREASPAGEDDAGPTKRFERGVVAGSIASGARSYAVRPNAEAGRPLPLSVFLVIAAIRLPSATRCDMVRRHRLRYPREVVPSRNAMETYVSTLDIAALDATPLTRDPFDFVIVDNFLRAQAFSEVLADFPRIHGPGSHPPGPNCRSRAGSKT